MGCVSLKQSCGRRRAAVWGIFVYFCGHDHADALPTATDMRDIPGISAQREDPGPEAMPTLQARGMFAAHPRRSGLVLS